MPTPIWSGDGFQGVPVAGGDAAAAAAGFGFTSGAGVEHATIAIPAAAANETSAGRMK